MRKPGQPGAGGKTSSVGHVDIEAPFSSEPSSRTTDSPHHKSGCFLQLKSTIWRVLVLLRREWPAALCEFFVPIIFVLGSVGIWFLVGVTNGDAADYYDTTFGPQAFRALTADLKQGMCYNASVGRLDNIPPCDFVNNGSSLYCPRGSGIPDGWCYPRQLFLPVMEVASLVQGRTSIIPTLDDVIALHWCNMDQALSVVANTGARNALSHGGRLYFAPDNAGVRELVNAFRRDSKYFSTVYGGTFSTVAEAEEHMRDTKKTDPPNWGIIQVNSFSPSSFDVSIRLNATSLPATASPTSLDLGGLIKDNSEMYLLSGFVTMQTMIYDYYVTNVLGSTMTAPSLSYTPMPTPAYKADRFLAIGGQFAPLIIVLGFMYPVSQLTKRIVIEKELRIREAMLIMGLSEGVMYLSWCIVYLAQHLVTSIIISVVLHVTYLPRSNPAYTFVLYFLFSCSAMTLSGVAASIFSKAQLAGIVVPLAYYIMSVPMFAMASAPASAKMGVLILSPSAVAVGFQMLCDREVHGGAHLRDLTISSDGPSFLIVFVFLIVDTVLYLLLMMYFDLVIPKDWGTTKHPLFFIVDPIRRCCMKSRDPDIEDGRAADGVFEPIEDEANSAVRILGLRKKFKRNGESFLAVNNLYWSLKEGEISVLLGHNGAGKSTTMNLMTGMLDPDGGDCLIYGKSIRRNLRSARQDIGLCPQHNILWPKLTVREHLEYFASIKGLSGHQREAAVRHMITAVDMEEKEHSYSERLSGGQKRRLSVAIAFVGGSRLIFLDEPTAGMDVGARHHTWDLLKEMSRGHTILLSTHFMDEADLLGSQVAILNEGRLQCSGSNVFLKSRLGVGFVLTLSITPSANRQVIRNLVLSHVPSAEALNSGAGEAAYRLPMHAKGYFQPLLNTIEESGEAAYGITAFSISATTLEEVFLRIASGDEEEGEQRSSGSPLSPNQLDPVAGSAVWNVAKEERASSRAWLQFRAMMAKRFWNSLRNRRTQWHQILCPVMCVLIAMCLSLINFSNTPAKVLTGDIYRNKVEVPVANCAAHLDILTPFSDKTKTVYWNDVTTGAQFSNRLSDTYTTHERERYGGISCDTVPLFGQVFDGIFYNSSASHEIGISTATFYNARLRQVAGNAAVNLKTTVQPLPQTRNEVAVFSAVTTMIIASVVRVGFTFIPPTFVVWIVRERECKARHLQNVSGLNFYIYWLSNLLYDFTCYMITLILILIIFVGFKRKEYIGREAIGPMLVANVLFGVSGVLMSYILSFLFTSHTTAQSVTLIANFFVGFLLVLLVSILLLLQSPGAVKSGNILPWAFRVVPSFCIGEVFNNLAMADLFRALDVTASPWDMDTTGWPCVYMAIEIPVFLFIILFLDHPARRKCGQRLFHNPDAAPEVLTDVDEDVNAEKEAVLSNPSRAGDLVRVRHLRKVYSSNGKVAVRNLTFGVKPGEVFGFLGTNGAGKTTTISILCQELDPTSGHASICGHDIVNDSQAALRCVGYCPQFDACLDLLTVEEHMYLYAGIRGVLAASRKTVVEGLLSLCALTPYRTTRAEALSGGNRRKLSVAISLIGGPRVVFLDEPSAGMDPVARRGLWNAIQAISDKCSILLTTHHLEEVEALAHRIAIIYDGSLRCIGNKTHLKRKYGSGFYEVTLRVGDSSEETLEAVKVFFQNKFPGSKVLEERVGRVTFQLSTRQRLSNLFGVLEANQERYHISDYNVSQTSIEQVFMRISAEAEKKEEEEEARRRKAKSSKKCCLCCR